MYPPPRQAGLHDVCLQLEQLKPSSPPQTAMTAAGQSGGRSSLGGRAVSEQQNDGVAALRLAQAGIHWSAANNWMTFAAAEETGPGQTVAVGCENAAAGELEPPDYLYAEGA